MANDPRSDRCEEIRRLRTELMLRRESHDRAEVISIVSAKPQEGRSNVAAELAIGFAQTGARTLLVDADMRNPTQHQLFGTHDGPGLKQLLEDGHEPVLHQLQHFPTLEVITAGDTPTHALELLSSYTLLRQIERWRESYQFVLIDTPAVSRWSDAVAISDAAGRALVVTRGGHTRFTDLRGLLRRLAATRCRVMGAVVNYF